MNLSAKARARTNRLNPRARVAVVVAGFLAKARSNSPVRGLYAALFARINKSDVPPQGIAAPVWCLRLAAANAMPRERIRSLATGLPLLP